MKTCFKCQLSMPITEFYAHPRMADGHLNKCKECTKLDVRETYRARRHERKRYEREREQRPERKAKKREYAQRGRATNPHKRAARQAVAAALRVGLMSRCPCEVCGRRESQAHHEDYAKPLDVRWLCFEHHRAVHGQVVI